MAKRKRRVTVKGFQPTSNPAYAKAMIELRRSSAASFHTPRPRKGSRRERERQSIRDSQRG